MDNNAPLEQKLPHNPSTKKEERRQKKELKKEERIQQKRAAKEKRQQAKLQQKHPSEANSDSVPNEEVSNDQKNHKLIKLNSTQMWSPVSDIKDGIVLTKDGRCVQILEFAPINFDLRPMAEQDAIADIFGSSIRIFPRKFQLKILSRRANVESHIQQIRQYMDTETNAQCRRMQLETMSLIQQNGHNGVSKRFFLAFPFEPPNSIRSPSWEDIRGSLFQQASQIISCLEGDPCGNELLSPLGNTDHVMGILYDCLNRAEAERKSLDTKIDDVVISYLMHSKLEDGQTIPPNDFLAPESIDPSDPNFLIVDGKYHAYGYIPKGAYPLECYSGWLSILVNLGEGIDIDIFVEKQSSDKTKQSLTRILNLTEADYRSKDDSAADIEEIKNKIAAGKYIQSRLANDQDFMYFSVMVSIIASSEEELRQKIRWINSILIARELRLRMLNFRHLEAFRSSLPLCDLDPGIFKNSARNILSGDFGAAYPFLSYEINDQDGIMLGINKINLSPVFVNQFDRSLYSNGNMAIFGGTGSGKTYLLQCIAMRMRQQQVQTIIIAPHKGHEYRRACDAVGGQFISLAPGSIQNINILEIRKYDTTSRELLDGADSVKGSILNQKLEQLNIFFSMLMPDMSHEESYALSDALIAIYKKYHITQKNKSLLDPENPTRYRQMPVLGDLYQELERNRVQNKRLLSVLHRFVFGSARSFNSPTNVDLSNPYVVIDVSNMTDDLLPLGIFIATEFVSDTVMADRTKRKAVIWDELHRLISKESSRGAADYVLDCWKLFRAFNVVCICATQDANDFFALQDGVYGKRILSNTKLKIIMKVEPTEADALSGVVDISSQEKRNIQYFKRGEALLIANRNHAEIKVTASPLEDSLITTDPEQLEKQMREILKRKEK